MRKEPPCAAHPSTTDCVDRPPQGMRGGSGGLRLDRTPGRVDRPGLPTRRRIHPLAVAEFPGLPPGDGATRGTQARRAGLGRRGGPVGIRRIGRVCRIKARQVYRALGAEEFHRHSRITSRDVLARRLLSLDYVLEHPCLPWLPTEAENVAAFEVLGIERRILPQRTHRARPDTSDADFTSACRSRCTPSVRSTSLPATKPRRRCVRGERRTGSCGGCSGSADSRSKSWPLR